MASSGAAGSAVMLAASPVAGLPSTASALPSSATAAASAAAERGVAASSTAAAASSSRRPGAHGPAAAQGCQLPPARQQSRAGRPELTAASLQAAPVGCVRMGMQSIARQVRQGARVPSRLDMAAVHTSARQYCGRAGAPSRAPPEDGPSRRQALALLAGRSERLP